MLHLSVVTLRGAVFEWESSIVITGKVDEQSEYPTELEVSCLESSHSGRVITVCGTNMLRFYAVTEQERQFDDGMDRSFLQLELLENCEESYPEICACDFVSCLCLPPPKPKPHCDWIVVASSDGSLYGFPFFLHTHGGVELNLDMCGRFRRNPHSESGSAVTHLVATFSADSNANLCTIQERGISYFRFLQKAPHDERLFYSLDEKGKLVSWELKADQGWVASQEAALPLLTCNLANDSVGSNSSQRYTAACSSRLVPHVVVTIDSFLKSFLCLDRQPSGEVMLGGYFKCD
jgi:hypothetical protein